jgi:hypothetical protein
LEATGARLTCSTLICHCVYHQLKYCIISIILIVDIVNFLIIIKVCIRSRLRLKIERDTSLKFDCESNYIQNMYYCKICTQTFVFLSILKLLLFQFFQVFSSTRSVPRGEGGHLSPGAGSGGANYFFKISMNVNITLLYLVSQC